MNIVRILTLAIGIIVAAAAWWRFTHIEPPPPPPPAAPPPPAVVEAPPAPAASALPEVSLRSVPIHEAPPDPPARGPDRHVSPEVLSGPASSPPPSVPRQFSGAATVTGPTAFQIGSVPVQLYGIKPPAQADRCRPGAAGDCASASRTALAAKLTSGTIACQVPRSRPGQLIAFAVCRNPTGDDVAQFLVAEGLALADPAQSYDYVAAEAGARTARRGLWAFR